MPRQAQDGVRSIDLGDGARASLVQAGTFRLDIGTAMGPVPEKLWRRVVHEEIDKENRVLQALNCVLVDTPSGRILIETGLGERMDDDARSLRGVEGTPILSALRLVDVEPEAIDFVVLSHLHFDHAGGLLAPDGTLAFPRASIVAQRSEWAAAMTDNARIAASYDQSELAVVHATGQLVSSDGVGELVPGIELLLTGGHTSGHQAVLVHGSTATLAYFGDLAMRPWSISPSWVTAYDDFPLDSIEAKRALFRRAADERWLVVLSHELAHPIGRIEWESSRPHFVPV